MRTYTVLLSVIVHAIAAASLFVVPIVANRDLPEPRRTTAFVIVTPVVPVSPPPVMVRSRPPAVDAAPLFAPEGVQPEPPAPLDGLDTPSSDTGLVIASDAGAVPPSVMTPPPVVDDPRPAAPVRVGGDIRPPVKILHVAPEYPALARASRTSGVVILEALIGEDGAVRSLRVLRSVPLLDDAAMTAVRQWRFSPTLLNGTPVAVVMTVTVSFTLN